MMQCCLSKEKIIYYISNDTLSINHIKQNRPKYPSLRNTVASLLTPRLAVLDIKKEKEKEERDCLCIPSLKSTFNSIRYVLHQVLFECLKNIIMRFAEEKK